MAATSVRRATIRRRWRWSRLQGAVRSAVVHVVVAAGSTVFLLPLLWMVSTSFKTPQQAFLFPPEWIPRPFVLTPYVQGWANYPFAIFLKNTVIISCLAVIGVLVSSTVVAYGFARLRFRGRNVLFVLLLSTMMLPHQVTMIPIYIGFARLGFVNTFVPLVLPLFFGVPVHIFLLRQFFLTLPRELDDAAKIDGAGYFGIFWRICLPLSKPALAAVSIFTFIYNWNDFALPLIYLQTQSLWTISIGLLQFIGSTFMDLPALMAMSTMALLPEIIIFFLAQKYFVQGIVMTGIKG
jgi:multiple sugar transport system permease protein